MWLWLFLLSLLFVLYKLIFVPFLFWKRRGVPHEIYIPLVGCFGGMLLGKKSFYDIIEDAYNNFPQLRYNGIYQMTSPNLLLRDLDLIKQIGVKNFDHFMDHQQTSPEEVLLSRNLFALKGNDWRNMRAHLSPAFTSAKMKLMHNLISDCAERLIVHYKHSDWDEQQIEVELKDLFTKYTNDVIATCAFGLECDSLKDPTNTFYRMGKDATSFEGLKGLRMMLANFAPAVFRLLKTTVLSNEVTSFFIGMIKDTIAYRERNDVARPDIINLLLEARKGKVKHESIADAKLEAHAGFAVVEESELGKEEVQGHLSDIDIAGQAFIFFFAGFDTSSTLLSFTASELAIYPDVQVKLVREIDDVMDRCKNKPSYEEILNMKYLDMVVSESLRKWPPAPSLDRKCTRDFTIAPVNQHEGPVHLKKGDSISIPIFGIHRDPKYFPNPTCFDPERFSEENKHKIVPYSYMPFGVGPRACIGSRFALLEAKILLVHMLRHFEFVVVGKTCAPLKLSTKTMRVQPVNGFWIGMKLR